MDFPLSVVAVLTRQLADLGRVGATNVVRVPDVLAAVPVFAAGTPGETAAPPLTFQESGYALALYGQERAGTPAKFASTEFRVQFNGETDLITFGDAGPAFFPMLAAFGGSNHWFGLMRRVYKREVWQITYRNFDAAAVANPSCMIAFMSDVEVARQVKALQQGG